MHPKKTIIFSMLQILASAQDAPATITASLLTPELLTAVGSGKCYAKNREAAAAPAPEPAPAPQPQPPAPPPAPAPAEENSDLLEGNFNVEGFKGVQTNGIASWFRANHGQDATNGNSWCGYKYTDYGTNGFAPDIRVMTGGSNAVWPDPRYEPSAQKYCGLEALVRTEDNKTRIMYIVDAFDYRWIKRDHSIDIMIGAWEKLLGRKAIDKNDVYNVDWHLTGKKSKRYCFKCKGVE